MFKSTEFFSKLIKDKPIDTGWSASLFDRMAKQQAVSPMSAYMEAEIKKIFHLKK